MIKAGDVSTTFTNATTVGGTASASTTSTPSVIVTYTATETEWDKIKVTAISPYLQISGQKGTVVLPDPTKGVNKTAEIEYGRAAAASELKFEGVFNTLTSKIYIGTSLTYLSFN